MKRSTVHMCFAGVCFACFLLSATMAALSTPGSGVMLFNVFAAVVNLLAVIANVAVSRMLRRPS